MGHVLSALDENLRLSGLIQNHENSWFVWICIRLEIFNCRYFCCCNTAFTFDTFIFITVVSLDKTCHMIPSYISTVGKQQIIDGTIAAETSFFIIFLISNTKSLGAQQIKTKH